MKKILFICHGNICRSTMAEMIFREMARKNDLPVEVDSAAVSREEIGNPIYPPAREELQAHGIPIGQHRARQVTREDYYHFDYLIVMDSSNEYLLLRLLGGDPEHKISRMLSWAGRSGEVADPWYTDCFDLAYNDIEAGCKGLLQHIRNAEEKS